MPSQPSSPPHDPESAPAEATEDQGLLTGERKRKYYVWEVIGAVLFVIALGALGYAYLPKRRVEDDGKVHWTPCKEDPTMFCTVFEVPTDYDDPSAGVTRLAMTKVPATKEPRQGSLLTNYGGPGGPGYTASFTFGKNFLTIYAPTYDLISWDPRGIGRTTPNVDCYEGGGLDALLAKANTPLEDTMDVPSNPYGPTGRAHMITQQEDAMTLLQMQMEKCGEKMGGDVLKYMGTTTLIKDMERIQAALDGPDADINLVSGSYGTIVAAYLVNMLPHKVGKVFTTGVVLADDWTNQHYENYNLLSDLLEDSEATLDWFVRDCYDAGEACALYHKNDKGPHDIKHRIDLLLDELYVNPLVVRDANRPGLLKSGMVRSYLFGSLQNAESWSATAQGIADAIRGNGTTIRNRLVRAYNATPEHDGWVNNNQGDLARLAVSCADMPMYGPDEALPTATGGVERLQNILRKVSPHFGATVHLMEQHGMCQFWPKAKHPIERFTGPWNSTLKNPIIVGSNTHDPITPRSQGVQMAELLHHSARHFVQQAPGHSMLAEPMSTYVAAVQAYFENGTLPEEFETFFPSEGRNYFHKPKTQHAFAEVHQAAIFGL